MSGSNVATTSTSSVASPQPFSTLTTSVDSVYWVQEYSLNVWSSVPGYGQLMDAAPAGSSMNASKNKSSPSHAYATPSSDNSMLGGKVTSTS